jgi:hypothetical protein
MAAGQVEVDVEQGDFADDAAALQRKAGARADQSAAADDGNFHRFLDNLRRNRGLVLEFFATHKLDQSDPVSSSTPVAVGTRARTYIGARLTLVENQRRSTAAPYRFANSAITRSVIICTSASWSMPPAEPLEPAAAPAPAPHLGPSEAGRGRPSARRPCPSSSRERCRWRRCRSSCTPRCSAGRSSPTCCFSSKQLALFRLRRRSSRGRAACSSSSIRQ